MASPLPSGKQSVDLARASHIGGGKGSPGGKGLSAGKGLGVSKIRRDPPPAVKEIAAPDADEHDTRTVVLGILAFTVALVVIMIGLGNAVGWTPREYVAHL